MHRLPRPGGDPCTRPARRPRPAARNRRCAPRLSSRRNSDRHRAAAPLDLAPPEGGRPRATQLRATDRASRHADDADQEESMNVLVTAASKEGSTTEIAEAIAQTLRRRGLETTVSSPERVGDVRGYDAFVIGSAAYMSHWLEPATD